MQWGSDWCWIGLWESVHDRSTSHAMATLITCWLHARTLHFPELQNMSILGLRNDKNDNSYSYIIQTQLHKSPFSKNCVVTETISPTFILAGQLVSDMLNWTLLSIVDIYKCRPVYINLSLLRAWLQKECNRYHSRINHEIVYII